MNGHLLKRSLAVVMMCLGLSSNAWAQSAVVHIGDQWSCSFAPGFQILNVNFSAAGPVATARFKVVASSAVTFVTPPNGEFDVSLNPCGQSGQLGQLIVIVPAGPAVTLTVVPATGHAEIELTDCDGYSLPTVQECDLARNLGPYRPTPTDGATDVPTNQLLSYVGYANLVAISTSPDMANYTVICGSGENPCPLPLNPGSLAPNTTYYWQASNHCICGQVAAGHSEVFSFTTGETPIAVQPSTWGRVKAMYR